MDNRAQKGLLLKQVRESKGISLGAVHEATKIPLDSLRAIEEGYKVRTLSPFYLKGFLKMYASYLEVDIKEVVDDYRPEKLPQHEKIIVEKADVLEKLNKIFTKERKRQ